MKPFDIRWHNFRAFKDTSWVRIKPLTIIIGANGSGKTSLIAPALMMRQTLDSNDDTIALRTNGELFSAGTFSNLIHDHNAKLPLTLSFRRADINASSDGPNSGPTEFHFSFSPNCEDESSPLLNEYSVFDAKGHLFLRRRRQKNGSYSVEGPGIRQGKSPASYAIKNARPEHFLFPVEPILSAHFRAGSDKSNQTKKNAKKKTEEGFSKRYEIDIKGGDAMYMAICAVASRIVEESLRRLVFVGPLREHPRRLYEVIGETNSYVGVRGEYTAEMLYRMRKDPKMSEIDKWLQEFNFGKTMRCVEVTPGAFTVFIRRTTKAPRISLADTGFGLSQVLPLIVQTVFGKTDNIIMTEQPEIHLNPRQQASLADLFVSAVNAGKGVVVETHSEHLILRIRRYIAEKKLKASDVALYFTDKRLDTATVNEIPIAKNGHIAPDKWPERFFEDALHESMALAMHQVRRK
jgi:predicted ATPase